jgi:hypothetical protein
MPRAPPPLTAEPVAHDKHTYSLPGLLITSCFDNDIGLVGCAPPATAAPPRPECCTAPAAPECRRLRTCPPRAVHRFRRLAPARAHHMTHDVT